jgi:hypothetical protein
MAADRPPLDDRALTIYGATVASNDRPPERRKRGPKPRFRKRLNIPLEQGTKRCLSTR